MPAAPAHLPLRTVWAALRPRQWLKNAVVLAAFFFGRGDLHQDLGGAALGRALAGAMIFCLGASSVYLLNDVLDRAQDRAHPRKRLRPVASGALPVATALILAAALGLMALGLGLTLSPAFAVVLAAYIALQGLYSFGLRRVPFVDVLVIAAGFVLRAQAGGAAVDVPVSRWLLGCTFALALFLALCKRRSEHALADTPTDRTRPGLAGVSRRVLDAAVWGAAAGTLGLYTAYAISPVTVQRFGTRGLVLTVPLVALGLARYLRLVFRDGGGEAPEDVLWTDRIMWAVLGAYAFTVTLVFVIR